MKILPTAFVADPDRLARFQREAQVLASLNHPNIAAIYGFENSGTTQALVLELVEGSTLAERLVEGPIPLVDAIAIAKQIAEALDAFVSDETGEYQVYVTAYPGPGPTVAVSTKGGLSPIWAADGGELYFRVGNKLLTARVSNRSPIAFSAPVQLFDGPYTLDLMGHQREDVAPDGRFLMVENSDDFPIVIVQNWPMELARLVR